MVTAGVWPLLHLPVADEGTDFHGNIPVSQLMHGRLKGLLSVGFGAIPEHQE